MLNRAKEIFKVYQSNMQTAKYNLSVALFSHYDKYHIRDYKMEIDDCRYMMNSLSKEIRGWKEEIYKAQKSYSEYDRKETKETNK